MATRTIKTQFELSGEKQYREAMAQAKSELALLNSELKKSAAEFEGQENSIAALTTKSQLLEQKYQAQSDKVSALRSALDQTRAANQKYADDLPKLSAQLDQAKKKLEQLENSTEDTKDAQAEARKEIDSLQKKLEGTQKAYDRSAASIEKYQKALNYAEADMISTGRELENTKRYLGEAQQSANGLATSIDGYGKATKSAGEQSSLFGQVATLAMDKVAGALTAGGLIALIGQLAGAVKSAYKSATEFETAMAKVATIADTAHTPLSQLSADILALSTKTGVAAESVAESVYQAISAGVDTVDAVEFADRATQLSIGGFTDAATAVDTLTTAINAYGKSTEDAEHIADVLITTQNLGKTSVDQLGQSMGQVIPIAAAFNVTLEDLSTAYAKLTADGNKTAEAGTGLKAMLSELGDTGSEVSRILLDQTGKSFVGLTGSGKSLGDVLQILTDSVGGNAAEFKNLWSSTEAGTSALSLVKQSSDEYNETLQQITDSAGAASDAYETMADTAERSSSRVKTALANMAKSSAEPATDIGKDITDGIADYLESGTLYNQLLDERRQKEKELQEQQESGIITAEEYKDAYDELIETYGVYLTAAADGTYEEVKAREAAREEAEAMRDTLDELTESYDGTAEGMGAFIEAMESGGTTGEAINELWGEQLTQLQALQTEMQALEDEYVKAKEEAYNNLEQTMGMFETLSTTVDLSVQDMIASLDSQLAWMDTYQANLAEAARLGVDEGLIRQLSDGSVESANILAGIVADGGQNVDELNEKFRKVQEGKEAFSGELADMSTDYTKRAAEIKAQTTNLVNDFNRSFEAYQAGIATIKAYGNGIRDYGWYVQDAVNSSLPTFPSSGNSSEKKSSAPRVTAPVEATARGADWGTSTPDTATKGTPLVIAAPEFPPVNVYLDTGVLVGELSPRIDKKLGKQRDMTQKGAL